MKVAVLGTGTMGAGMARNLLQAGLDVTAWNRTPERAEPLKDDGATVATSVTDAVQGADAVLTMVFDGAAVLGLAAEMLTAMPAGAVWVQSATVGLDAIESVRQRAADREIALLDAPMLGTKQPAEQGKLVPLVSGDPALIEAMGPVFDAVGTKTVRAGTRIGQGTALKLACNAWIASLTAALGQSVALAQALGVPPELFLEAIDGGPASSPYAQLKGHAMLDGEFEPSFSVDGVAKDVGLMIDAAVAAGFPQLLLRPVRQAYLTASGAGHGGDDIAAVCTTFAPTADH